MDDQSPRGPYSPAWRKLVFAGGWVAALVILPVLGLALYIALALTWYIFSSIMREIVYPIFSPSVRYVLSGLAVLIGGWVAFRIGASPTRGAAPRGSIRAILAELGRTYAMGAALLAALTCAVWIFVLWRPLA